jgi:hypothetical protein
MIIYAFQIDTHADRFRCSTDTADTPQWSSSTGKLQMMGPVQKNNEVPRLCLCDIVVLVFTVDYYE